MPEPSEIDRAVAAVLAREARGWANIANAQHRHGDAKAAQWMITQSSSLACEAVRLDPSLGDALTLIVNDDGSERSLAEIAATTPDRTTALATVEALLRRVHDVTEEADDVVRFYLAGDGAFLRDVANMTAAELAALIVDGVLGNGGGETACPGT